jgi:hypothetical protein
MPTIDLNFDGYKALFLNGTLKRSPEPSNTEGLIAISRGIMEKHGVDVEVEHLANTALAHTRLGHDGAAIDMLQQIKRAAPQWLVVRRTAQMVIRELYDRATPPPLVDLARAAGLLR